MFYSKCQWISLGVKTTPGKKTNSYIPEYIGLSIDKKDIDSKVNLVAQAINESYYHASTASNCLKIFVMPEFFFRGSNGAYPIELSNYLFGKLKEIAVFGQVAPLQRHNFSSWLFFFGTSVFYSDISSNIKKNVDKEVYNVCFVQAGGVLNKDKNYIVMKEHLNPGDFLRQNYKLNHLHIKQVQYPPAFPAGKGKEQKKQNYDGNAIFDYKNIRFGVEICSDHLEHRLKNSPPMDGKQINIQVIVSHGLYQLDNTSFVAKNFVFCCDGSGPRSECISLQHGILSGQSNKNVKDQVPFKINKTGLFTEEKNHKNSLFIFQEQKLLL